MNSNATIETAAKYFETGDLQTADSICREILKYDKQNATAYHLRGVIAYQTQDYPSAITLLGSANHLIKNNTNIMFALAASYENTQQYAQAITLYQKLSSNNPNDASARRQLATCLEKNGDVKKSKIEFLTLHKENPKEVLFSHALARLFLQEKNLKKARYYAITSTDLKNNNADTWNNLGLLFKKIKLEELNQNHTNNSALSEDTHNAIMCFEQAIELENNHTKSRLNLASTLQDDGQFSKAKQHYQYAIAYLSTKNTLNNNALAMANYNLALIYLNECRYYQGWKHLVHRPKIFYDTPLTKDLKDKNILIVREEGLGDELIFLRFVPLLKALGCKIDYITDPKLLPVLENNPVFNQVYCHTPDTSHYDYRISLMDVPYILNTEDISTISPFQLENNFHSDPKKIALNSDNDEHVKIIENITSDTKEKKMGITWQAGVPNKDSGIKYLEKSIPIELFCKFLENYAGTIIILQRNPKTSDIDFINNFFKHNTHVKIIDASPLNNDLRLMMAALKHIDHYVCVSNTNTHLFGSLLKGENNTEKKCDVLIPYPGEWRWPSSRNSSPWYPNFEVHHQLKDLSWDETQWKL